MFLHQHVPVLQDRIATQPVQTFFAAFVSLLFSYILINEVVRYSARVRGMKGPPGLPLIGNMWSIRTNAAAQYYEWSKEYGDVYQVQIGNVPVVVVNSAKAAKQLWVGQSQALSSRPVTYTFHKVRFTGQNNRLHVHLRLKAILALSVTTKQHFYIHRSQRLRPVLPLGPLHMTTPSSARRRAPPSPSTGRPSQATCPT